MSTLKADVTRCRCDTNMVDGALKYLRVVSLNCMIKVMVGLADFEEKSIKNRYPVVSCQGGHFMNGTWQGSKTGTM